MWSSKKLPIKVLYGRCLSEFIDWRYIHYSIMLVFSTQLCELDVVSTEYVAEKERTYTCVKKWKVAKGFLSNVDYCA
jgi:hypothetical protein